MSQVLRRYQRYAERAADMAKVINIVETGVAEPKQSKGAKRYRGRSAEGDEQRLRYIPVCTYGVTAVIPGTQPLDAVIANEARAIRRGSYSSE